MPTINGKACVANGRNLIVQSDLKTGYIDPNTGVARYSSVDFYSHNYIATNGATVFTFSSPDYTFKGSSRHTLAMYDSDKNYLGRQPLASAIQTLSKSNVAYIRFSINSGDEGNITKDLSDWLANHRYKLEKGSVATPLTPAPVDKVYSNGRQVYGRNLLTNSAQMFSKTTSAGGNNVISTKYFLTGGLSLYQIGINEGDWFTFSYDFNLEATSDLEPFTDGMFVQWEASPWGMVRGTLQTQSYIDTVISGGTPEISFLLKDSCVAVKVKRAGSGRVYVHIPMPNVTQNAVNQLNFRLDAQEGKLTVGKIKMERGRLGTPWTPAPEDVM